MSLPTTHSYRCPGCASPDVDLFYTLRGMPCADAVILDREDEAITFPRGDIELAFCTACGFVFNAAFAPELTEYSTRYEERQSASPTFSAFQRGLAERLIATHDLRRKTVVEIGCGKGEFLAALCELGDNRGIGFDPAWRDVAGVVLRHGRIEIHQRAFDDSAPSIACDLVLCRMTLEHIAEVGRFVRQLARWLKASPYPPVLFQVPDADRIFAEGAFWDVYYEHPSYFTESSLHALFAGAGFDVRKIWREYGSQYLTIEAAYRDKARPTSLDPNATAKLVEHFRVAAPAQRERWRGRLDDWSAAGQRIAIWGSGSKAVSFLSTLGIGAEIGCVIDINPARHGKFVPGSGHAISAPARLRDYRPDRVILMNPVYRDEVVRMLDEARVETDLVSL